MFLGSWKKKGVEIKPFPVKVFFFFFAHQPPLVDVTWNRNIVTVGCSYQTPNGHYIPDHIFTHLVVDVFAIYQLLLNWKQYEYYYETVELPNPRPTQPHQKKFRLKAAFWATSSHSK